MIRNSRFVRGVACAFLVAVLSGPLAVTAQPAGRVAGAEVSRALEGPYSLWIQVLDFFRSWSKAGAGMDPNGVPAAGPAGAGSGEAGGDMDPNGAPVRSGSGAPLGEAGGGMDPNG